MYKKLIKNDIGKSKLITATVAGFILISALLISLAAMLSINLFGAIDNMMTSAKSPHFMRMHAGDVDVSQVKKFAENNSNVEKWQVIDFLNIDGAQIKIGADSLAWSSQDNGFSTQSKDFDFILGLDGKILKPKDGQIYFPLYYMKQGSAKVGDTVTIQGVKLTVAGFTRDSLMNPGISGSKRFLVSENDMKRLESSGTMEHLIEFRLIDSSTSTSLDSAYVEADMPANGPQAITYSLVKMMNGIEDGMMIAVLALISILVIIVAFLCIRFTLLAKIEEDYREIGVLKAVGMRVSDIKRLYMVKYGVIAMVASILGFLLSLLMQKPFMANIELYLGTSDLKIFGILAGFIGVLIVFAVIMLFVSGVLRRFRKISAAQAVRFGAPQEKTKSGKRLNLAEGTFRTNVFLALKDVLTRKKLYITMLLVIIISSFMIIVPQNIGNTVSSPNFMTNMGIGKSDISLLVSSASTQDVEGTATKIANKVAEDESVSKSTLMTTRLFEMPEKNGVVESMQVTLGDHDVFPISYMEGSGPKADNEIAISNIYAEGFGKSAGDQIVLIVDGKEKALTVSGVYSDITNAGKTAKAQFDVDGGDVLSASVWATLNEPGTASAKIKEYKEEFPVARVLGSDDMATQMLGDLTSAIGQASYAAIGIGALLTVLVTILFLKMLVTKDRYPIAILKSMGFTARSINRQYLLRSAIILVIGVAVGTVLANTAGEYVGLALISSFGASSFHFEINPLFAYIFAPLLLAACVYGATLLGVRDIRKVKIFEHIKEA